MQENEELAKNGGRKMKANRLFHFPPFIFRQLVRPGIPWESLFVWSATNSLTV